MVAPYTATCQQSMSAVVKQLFLETSHSENLQLYGALGRQIWDAVGALVVPAKKALYADLAEKAPSFC
jgi:hypothetical protein